MPAGAPDHEIRIQDITEKVSPKMSRKSSVLVSPTGKAKLALECNTPKAR
jgi:hypothetical protein